MGCGGYVAPMCGSSEPERRHTTGCGTAVVTGCGGNSSSLDEVDRRREDDYYYPGDSVNINGGRAIWSDEFKRHLGSGYKILKEIPSCSGAYYEAYDIDGALAEAIIELVSKKREAEEKAFRKSRR